MEFWDVEETLENWKEQMDKEKEAHDKEQRNYEKQYKSQQQSTPAFKPSMSKSPSVNYGGAKIPKVNMPKM